MRKPKQSTTMRSQEALSSKGALPLDCCLAKTRHLTDGNTVAGRTVTEHCSITGAIAETLLTRLPNSVRALFPAHAIVAPLTHDVGKVCPTFQEKIYRAIGLTAHRQELANADPNLEKEWGGHAAVSHAVLKKIQKDSYLPEVVGLHHGRNIDCTKPADSALFGGKIWEDTRETLVTLLTEGKDWPVLNGPEQALLLTGLTVVSDWIASGEAFDDPGQDWPPLIVPAVNAAGFQAPCLQKGLAFTDIFPFKANPVQEAFFQQVTGPGEYIMEAPMGLGKTEAAMYAAYQLLEKGAASGLYFALPTQLTSNKIHDRVNAFLERILVPHNLTHGAVLTHGAAWLKRFLEQEQNMGKDAAPGGAWFENSKRGILAPFAVGTIDQALMAAMRVRHAGVRALGLAGKVVILDEVHSYDAYTGVILEDLIRLLHSFNCTTIILSATLTRERRAALLGQVVSQQFSHDEYPLITAIPTGETITERGCSASTQHNVQIKMCRNDENALEEALYRAEQGQQILWLENTVAEAQKRYTICSARASAMNVETGLLHSRFTPRDREKNEALWTALYGARAKNRGETGRLLIGTQVLEQSLDIDADFLVTRICPTDMLFQRLGRLWRHARHDRAASAQREAWILAPETDTACQSPKTAFASTGYVYSPYILCRSLEVWDKQNIITMPNDIRAMLEATYAARTDEPTLGMQEVLNDLARERRQMSGQALQGLSSSGKIWPEESARTRIMQREEVKMLLLQTWNIEKKYCRLADGTECTLSALQQTKAERTRIAVKLALNTVRVPESYAPPVLAACFSRWFAPYMYEAKPKQNTLRAVLLKPDGTCADFYGSVLEGLRYTAELGYLRQA